MKESAPRWRTALREMGEILLPTECLGCGAWDEIVCDSCVAQLMAAPQRWELTGGPAGSEILPIYEVGAYEAALRRLVLHGKHDSRRELASYFVAAGWNLVQGVVATQQWAGAQGINEVFVVPAPSTRPKHPSPVTPAFSRGVMQGVVESGIARQAAVLEILEFQEKVTTQAGLSGAKRASNRHGQMRLITRLARAELRKDGFKNFVSGVGGDTEIAKDGLVDAGALEGTAVVIVDDVSATGSTLREMWRVLAAAGAEPLAGMVFASSTFAQSNSQSADVLGDI